MKLISRKVPPPVVFETRQQKLARLSGDVLRNYQESLGEEIHDRERLAQTYGAAFLEAGHHRQAEVVATMACQMLNVPNAQVNVILEDRQVTIARVSHGHTLPCEQTPLPHSFCQHVIGTGHEFSVENARDHNLVCDTRFARGGDIVSYLGVPIANRKRIIIGVLCVFDDVERNWGPAEVGILTQLSLVLTRTTE
jgi:GAF domain-containing protein